VHIFDILKKVVLKIVEESVGSRLFSNSLEWDATSRALLIAEGPACAWKTAAKGTASQFWNV